MDTLFKPRSLRDRRRHVTFFRLSVILILCILAAILGFSLHNIIGDVRANSFTTASVERVSGTIAAVGAMLASLITKRHVQAIKVEVDGHFSKLLEMTAERNRIAGKAEGITEGLVTAGVVPGDLPPGPVVAVPIAPMPPPIPTDQPKGGEGNH